MEVRLGVGHQAEDPARLVADPGDRVYGAVGVRGIVRRRFPVEGVAVLQRDQSLLLETFQCGRVLRDELPFAVADGQVEAPKPPRENAGGVGIDAEINPAVLEPPRVVEDQRNGLPVIRAVQAGEHPQLDEKLEAVADAEDQLSRRDEPGELIVQPLPASGDGRMENPVRAGLGRAEVVAVQKSAGQVQEVIVVKPLGSAEELADMDDIDFVEAGEAAGVGHLHLAVRPVSRDHDRTDFLRHFFLPLSRLSAC